MVENNSNQFNIFFSLFQYLNYLLNIFVWYWGLDKHIESQKLKFLLQFFIFWCAWTGYKERYVFHNLVCFYYFCTFSKFWLQFLPENVVLFIFWFNLCFIVNLDDAFFMTEHFVLMKKFINFLTRFIAIADRHV